MPYHLLICRRRNVHKKTVSMFPGNNIPIIRGNMSAKRKLEELVSDCRDLINPDIGYDEGMHFAIMSSTV